MSKLSKESLEQVVIPFFTSAVDGQTYTVTKAAMIAANIRDIAFSGLREVSPSDYSKAKAAEVEAIKKGDVALLRSAFVLLIELVAGMVPDGNPEHPLLRASRHHMTDMLEVLSPEDHAQYRAVKYAGSESGSKAPKANPAKRAEALSLAASVIAKAALVPGF